MKNKDVLIKIAKTTLIGVSATLSLIFITGLVLTIGYFVAHVLTWIILIVGVLFYCYIFGQFIIENSNRNIKLTLYDKYAYNFESKDNNNSIHWYYANELVSFVENKNNIQFKFYDAVNNYETKYMSLNPESMEVLNDFMTLRKEYKQNER